MKQRLILALLIVFASFSSCKDDADVVPAPVITGIENTYSILQNDELKLTPTVENNNEATYIWQLDGKEVAKTLEYVFVQSEARDYKLKLRVANEGGMAEQEMTITVVERGLPPVITNLEEEYGVEVEKELK